MIVTKFPIIACSVCGVIVVGVHWHGLSKSEQAAVIEHERGHAAKLHLLHRIWWVLSGRWNGIVQRCRRQEIEADQYATERGHGLGLLRMLGRAHNTPASDFHPSHRERIDNIRKWMRYGNHESAHSG